MDLSKNDIVPVLLGGDLNAYSMATSFARLGISSHVFAREALAVVKNLKYVDLHIVKDLDDCNSAVPTLIEFAKANSGMRLILIPCADWYMEMLEYARDALYGHFYFLIPDFEVWKTTSDKAIFLQMLKKYSISYPKTVVIDPGVKDIDRRCKTLRPPFVLKPSDSSEYWRNPFSGMEKVYFIDSLGEGVRLSNTIFGSGYSGKLLIQERIGASGGASAAVLTTFSTKEKKVVRAILGDVLLEELAPTARGNYAAIVTRKLDKISYDIIKMLDSIGYSGVANFDILYDKDGAYCLELNPRQGRSFDYLRCSGVNLAELFIAEMLGEVIEKKLSYECGFWRCTTKSNVKRFSDNRGLLLRAFELDKNNRSVNAYDTVEGRSISHRLYGVLHGFRQKRKFLKYKKEDNYAAF